MRESNMYNNDKKIIENKNLEMPAESVLEKARAALPVYNREMGDFYETDFCHRVFVRRNYRGYRKYSVYDARQQSPRLCVYLADAGGKYRVR